MIHLDALICLVRALEGLKVSRGHLVAAGAASGRLHSLGGPRKRDWLPEMEESGPPLFLRCPHHRAVAIAGNQRVLSLEELRPDPQPLPSKGKPIEMLNKALCDLGRSKVHEGMAKGDAKQELHGQVPGLLAPLKQMSLH